MHCRSLACPIPPHPARPNWRHFRSFGTSRPFPWISLIDSRNWPRNSECPFGICLRPFRSVPVRKYVDWVNSRYKSYGLGKFRGYSIYGHVRILLTLQLSSLQILKCWIVKCKHFEISLTVRRNHNLYNLSHTAVSICFLAVCTFVSSLIWLHVSSFTINAN